MASETSFPTSCRAGSKRLQATGAALVVFSTICIAIVPSFAKLAYEAGSNPLTVITARSLFSLLLTWVFLMMLGQSIRIERNAMLLSLAPGVAYAVMPYGFLGAVALIPVNLVILIFFFHPVLIGLATALLGDEPISARMLVCLLTAFVGLCLAIGLANVTLDLGGLALAGLSACACIFVIMGNGRATKTAGGLAVVFHMMLAATFTLTVLFLFLGTLVLPLTLSGWIGFSGVAVCSTAGTLAFFCAVPLLGAVRATMISNIEPLLGIGFALILLGEAISLLQALGIAIVIGAIVALEL